LEKFGNINIMDVLIALLVLAGSIWFWLDSIKVKELAVRSAAQACQAIQVQFLDQTVSLAKIKPVRNAAGRLTWRRIYTFEFTMQGEQRYKGQAIMRGQILKHVHLEKPDGLIIES
jgi:hypothetical protein